MVKAVTTAVVVTVKVKKGPGDIAFLWRSKARINERDTRILYSVLFAKLHSNLIKVDYI